MKIADRDSALLVAKSRAARLKTMIAFAQDKEDGSWFVHEAPNCEVLGAPIFDFATLRFVAPAGAVLKLS